MSKLSLPPSHPPGASISIVGIVESNRGRSCTEHEVCGVIVKKGLVVRFRVVKLYPMTTNEEIAIAVYSIHEGHDVCRVGFLPRHFIKLAAQFDGVLAKVEKVYSEDDENSVVRAKHHRMRGFADAVILPFVEIDSSSNKDNNSSKDDSKNTTCNNQLSKREINTNDDTPNTEGNNTAKTAEINAKINTDGNPAPKRVKVTVEVTLN